jgi:hypothetical protein
VTQPRGKGERFWEKGGGEGRVETEGVRRGGAAMMKSVLAEAGGEPQTRNQRGVFFLPPPHLCSLRTLPFS